MNAIELMDTVLARLFPTAERALGKPRNKDGFWSLDVRLPDYHLGIDWREQDGFSLTADPEHGYGEGADESFPDFATALPRIIQLVQHKLETLPPYPIRIKELRERMGKSQTEVAQQMGVLQGAVSKLESREDTHVGTLLSYVQALGGKLVMKAVFADREETIHFANNN
jgi:DNA-binding XRE family transcriptional regulator